MLKGLPTFLLGASVVLLTIQPLTPTVGFSQVNQESNRFNEMSEAEKILFRKIAGAGERRDWPTVQNLTDGYAGTAQPIWVASINAAMRCSRYREGALIFEKCKQNVKIKDEPLFNAAVRVLAKCEKWAQVQEVWQEVLNARKFGGYDGSSAACSSCR